VDYCWLLKKGWGLLRNSVDLFVLLWTNVDWCGLMWTAVDCCGLLWTAVYCCVLLWTAVDCCGLLWTVVDCCEFVWTVVGHVDFLDAIYEWKYCIFTLIAKQCLWERSCSTKTVIEAYINISSTTVSKIYLE
jgi:hypothetical protein